MNEQEFRAMVQATFKEDMQELMNGPITNIIDIIAKVYEKGFMKGLEFSKYISRQ